MNVTKVLSLKGCNLDCWDYCGSIIIKFRRSGVAPAGFPAASHGQLVDWTWSWKIKALHTQRVLP